jgi:hypothetical protein
MPGVQVAPFCIAPQCDPMGPPVGVQFGPLQHRGGLGADCGVQVNPEAHPPVESQRQPWLPTMHVELTPSVPEPVPEPLEPVEPPELPLELLPPVKLPVPPLDDDPELPQAHTPTTRTSDTDPTSARRRAGEVRSFMTFLRGGANTEMRPGYVYCARDNRATT